MSFKPLNATAEKQNCGVNEGGGAAWVMMSRALGAACGASVGFDQNIFASVTRAGLLSYCCICNEISFNPSERSLRLRQRVACRVVYLSVIPIKLSMTMFVFLGW
jgi:hypothetical protein